MAKVLVGMMIVSRIISDSLFLTPLDLHSASLCLPLSAIKRSCQREKVKTLKRGRDRQS